jgi:hypothetical protein
LKGREASDAQPRKVGLTIPGLRAYKRTMDQQQPRQSLKVTLRWYEPVLFLLLLLLPINTVAEPWTAASLVINVTANLNPQTIELDACHVMYCGGGQTWERYYYLCPEPSWGYKNKDGAGCWWLVILATQEAETGGSWFQGSPGK